MNILFVGSYFPLARAVQRGLQDEGIDVDLALSPCEAETLVSGQQYDALLVDLRTGDQ